MKDILLTGASGFLGSSIVKKLLHYNIIKLSRNNADVNADLSKDVPRLPVVDTVIHCAGKAHFVPKTEVEKQAFFDINVKGTENLLTAIEQSGIFPQYFIFISTVAVYGQVNGKLINEQAPLLATDAYGKSKIEAENLIQEWCGKKNVMCTILRLPLIAGTNPPGNLNAMIKGIKKGYYFNIDGGKARKSMVLAKDVAGIIEVAAHKSGIYNLTDGYHPSFKELSDIIASQLTLSKPKNMPLALASILAKVGDMIGERAPLNSAKLEKMTNDLTFDDTKAKLELGWDPKAVLNQFKIV